MPTIQRIEAFPVSLPRDLETATGTAGSPSVLQAGSSAYKWSTTVAAIYSERFESTLVRISTSDGLIGWGESQAPVAPRVSAVIVTDLLASVLEGEPFDGSRAAIEHLWDRMYQSMRVRGQTGGFMLDAMAGVDLALWDLAGKMNGMPVSKLIHPQPETVIPAYLSGLSGSSLTAKMDFARRHFEAGFRLFKVFFDKDEADLLATIHAVQSELGPEASVAVDALWRLEWPQSLPFIDELSRHNLYWLEAPFMPDEPKSHRALAKALPDLPVALGESYRTRREMSWFLDEGLVKFVQPDLGRCGMTESLRIASSSPGVEVVPHVSIALGPQIAAAIHLTAGLANATLCEFNPTVFETSNRLLEQPLEMDLSDYRVPQSVGLGVSPKSYHQQAGENDRS